MPRGRRNGPEPSAKDLAEAAEVFGGMDAQRHLDGSNRLKLADLVDRQTHFYRGWDNAAVDMLAKHMEELALRIRWVKADTPEDYDARHGIVEQDARKTWWNLGYEEGRAAGRREATPYRAARLTPHRCVTCTLRPRVWYPFRSGAFLLTERFDAMAVSTEKRQLRRVAYHESGHAVAAVEHRIEFLYATVVRDDDSLGHVLFPPEPERFEKRTIKRHLLERWINQRVLISLAGPAAERIVAGRYDHSGAESDYKLCVGRALRCYSDDTASKFIDFKLSQAWDFVQQPHVWLKIEKVADALIAREKLSAREIKAICREACKDDARFREIRKILDEREDARQAKLRAKLGLD
jgi:hypothetical protein